MKIHQKIARRNRKIIPHFPFIDFAKLELLRQSTDPRAILLTHMIHNLSSHYVQEEEVVSNDSSFGSDGKELHINGISKIPKRYLV